LHGKKIQLGEEVARRGLDAFGARRAGRGRLPAQTELPTGNAFQGNAIRESDITDNFNEPATHLPSHLCMSYGTD